MNSGNCKQCGAKFVRFPIAKGPLWEGEPWKSKPLWKNINWKNAFKMEIMSIVFGLVMIFMIVSYKIDIEQFEDIKENPCGFCAGASEICKEDKRTIGPSVVEIPLLDIKIPQFENT